MFSNRYMGLFAGMLVASLAMTGGCRSRTKDRIRVLEAERSDLQRQNSSLKSELANKSSRESELIAERDKAQAELSAMRMVQATDPAPSGGRAGGDPSLGNELGDALGGGGTVRSANGVTTVTLASDITFPPGRAELSPSAQETLGRVAKVIRGRDDIRQIRVEGHTDTDPIKRSGWSSNEALSDARAMTVKRLLAARGVPEELMSTHGFGPTQPIASNDSKEGKSKNRRVEIIVVTR